MSLKDESEPIEDDEWLIRRVPSDRFREHRQPYVSPGAFEPRTKGKNPDEDGISLFRLACLGNIQPILDFIGDAWRQANAGFVQVQVSEILELGMTVVITRNDDIMGHVSIPELNADAMRDAEKRRPVCRERMMALAELASKPGRILRDPNRLFDADSDAS